MRPIISLFIRNDYVDARMCARAFVVAFIMQLIWWAPTLDPASPSLITLTPLGGGTHFDPRQMDRKVLVCVYTVCISH